MGGERGRGDAPARSGPVGTARRRNGMGVQGGRGTARLGRHERVPGCFPNGHHGREPNRESALADAADFADEAGRHNDAIAYWRARRSPSARGAEYHGRLAFALFAGSRLGAKPQSRAAPPRPPQSRRPSWPAELLVRCELRLKRPRGAAPSRANPSDAARL